MRILIGLGNPTPEYELTRHNAGKRAVQFLADQHLAKFEKSARLSASIAKLHLTTEVMLVLPECYMNESGQVVRGVLDFYKVASTAAGFPEVVLLYDDLDIAFGEYKVQFGTGPKVHNGLNSVVTHLGTDQFWHGRIGIDARGGERLMPGRDYVLQRLAEPEIMHLQEKTFPLLHRTIDQLMIAAA